MAVTGEYAGGTMRVTLTAQPRRGSLVIAKMLAVGGVTAAAAAVSVVATFAVNSAVLAGHSVPQSGTSTAVVRALLGSVLYLALISALGTAAGLLLRSTATALATGLGVLYLPSLLVLLLPPAVAAAVSPYTPANAGAALMQLQPGALLTWPVGLAVLAAYVTTLTAGGVALLARRDA